MLVIFGLILIVSSCAGASVDKPDKKTQNSTSNESGADKILEQTGLEQFAGLEGTIDIAGGTAHITVMEKAAERIMKANSKIKITITGGGSGVGVQKVGEELVQIGNTGRSLSDEEIEKYGLKSFPFCVDGVTACVHPDNSVSELTSKQLQDIFAGIITNWKDVGGNDASINLYGRDEASGTRSTFWKKALNKGDVAEKVNIVASNGAMRTSVSNDPNAIGYVGIGHLDSTIKSIILDGVEPSQEKAKTGEYPVTRFLFMNTKGEPDGLVKAFIDYIQSDYCHDIIESCGYIPL
ncbi:phosphate ABC transporter substrate-binding protein [bacterium]|nr:phosphate ABC transporter substrate-binding protein [bacterium]